MGRLDFCDNIYLWSVGLQYLEHLSLISDSLSFRPKELNLIDCDKSCDIRTIETLICLESSHWLNLDDIIAWSQGQKSSTSLVTSVNASMALTKELPKSVLNLYLIFIYQLPFIYKLAHIFFLLSFFTERSNQFNSFTRLLHLWWGFSRYPSWVLFVSYSHMVIWPNGHNMALKPYWGHTKMTKRRPKMGVYWKPIINVATFFSLYCTACQQTFPESQQLEAWPASIYGHLREG